MDLPTSYGTRLLSPFDWHWFALDWVPIVDIYLLIALAAGLGFGGISRTVRRRNAAIVLTLVAANYGPRAVAHHEALVHAPRLVGPAYPTPRDPQMRTDSLVEIWPRSTAPALTSRTGADSASSRSRRCPPSFHPSGGA